jgi:hypothetical protein
MQATVDSLKEALDKIVEFIKEFIATMTHFVDGFKKTINWPEPTVDYPADPEEE